MDEQLSDQAFHEILNFIHLSRKYGSIIMNESGIKPRDFSVLHFLLENGPATVSDIQQFVHRSPSTTSSLISHLEEKGFLTRTRSTTDNRVVIVELTRPGRETIKRTHLWGLPLLRRELRSLPPEKLENIKEIFLELTNLMEKEPE